VTAHSQASGLDLHEAKRIKIPVRAASIANVALGTPGSTLDGVTLASGDRILLKDQVTTSDNGIYVWNGSANALNRASDAASASDFVFGFKVYVREGSTNGSSYWTFTQATAVTLGSTALTFAREGTGSGVSSVALTMPSDFAVSGSPITSSGTLAVTATTQTANTVKAGPSSGAAAAPTYRGLVSADLPSSPDFAIGANGQAIGIRALTELTTVAAAATTTTAIQIPAGCILLAVNVRVTVVIPTAATFTVIGNTSTTAYNTAAVSTAANTTDAGTAAGAVYNAAAQTVRITPNLTPGANTGRVRVSIFYILSTPPTS